jgi:hypothetical protein
MRKESGQYEFYTYIYCMQKNNFPGFVAGSGTYLLDQLHIFFGAGHHYHIYIII